MVKPPMVNVTRRSGGDIDVGDQIGDGRPAATETLFVYVAKAPRSNSRNWRWSAEPVPRRFCP